ncbi:hypothetical protein L226DRAFT_613779 [Lentinus tigrinus ALCF2SS1-7]|uniref:F-box domain-containing protein n=1 Tax=Lentinus tigrinus ALCF2SS1-6 TaxID=1328759 RepID=A0A5C2RYI7_9APHY|nr:hypothetical protein L227DRAFT_656420 [Lentinus tigrinus ALCF2SS1-6]RPD74007.1 hypothetical protein L226DRAFT_613779 [Lentinus tigrinus ALCF2SS1-7]
MASPGVLFASIKESSQLALRLKGSGGFDHVDGGQVLNAYRDLHKTLSVFNQVLNARCPVNKLPNEVLLHIFLLVPHSCSWPLESGCDNVAVQGAVDLRNVTLVCHKWRALALNYSSMWATLYLVPIYSSRNIENAQTCLDRRRSGTLSVQYDDTQPLNVLHGHEHRIREFRANASLLSWEDLAAGGVIPAYVSLPLSSVERLIIRGFTPYGRSLARNLRWKGMIPLFGGGPLPLRFLSLTNAIFLPAQHQVSNLTHLGLWFGMDPGNGAILPCSIDDILRLLSYTPMLQEAFIHGIPMTHPDDRIADNELYYTGIDDSLFDDDSIMDFPPDIGYHIPSRSQPPPVVELRHLRKFSTFSWVTSRSDRDIRQTGLSIFLLKHLRLPDSCYIRVDACTPTHLSFLKSYLKPLEWPETRVHCAYGRFSEREPAMSIQLTNSGGPGGIRIDITRTTHIPGSDRLISALRDLLSSAVFANARTLWVSGIERDWDALRVLHALHNIEQLFVDAWNARVNVNLYALLWEDRKDRQRQSTHSIPTTSFPLLRTAFVAVRSEFVLDELHKTLQSRHHIPHLLVQLFRELNNVSAAQMKEKLRDVATESGLVVYDPEDDVYMEKYSLRQALPPDLCGGTDDEYAWPPWLEGKLVRHDQELYFKEERSNY